MKRRRFLGYSLTGLVAMSSQPLSCLNTSLSEMPLHLKSLKWGMIKEDLSVIEKFKLIKQLRYDGVELDSPSDLDMKEVLSAMRETGIKIPGLVNSLHWSKPLSDPSKVVRQECIDSMKNALVECRAYGGNTVLLVPGKVKEDVSYEEAWERSTEAIHKILPVAKETGVRIAIENVWNNFLLSPLEAARYIDQFNSDHIGWYMDIGNVIRYGWPEHWIRILGKRIIKVDIKDYSRKKQTDEGIWEGFKVKLGEGSVDWSKVNQALAEVGYSGWGSAEVSGGDRERLKEISERMDRLYVS